MAVSRIGRGRSSNLKGSVSNRYGQLVRERRGCVLRLEGAVAEDRAVTGVEEPDFLEVEGVEGLFGGETERTYLYGTRPALARTIEVVIVVVENLRAGVVSAYYGVAMRNYTLIDTKEHS